MADLYDVIQREARRRSRDPEVRNNERLQKALRYDGVAKGRNDFADAFAASHRERKREAAREAVLDARDDLARLKREHAHRDDIADARDALTTARADVKALRRDED